MSRKEKKAIKFTKTSLKTQMAINTESLDSGKTMAKIYTKEITIKIRKMALDLFTLEIQCNMDFGRMMR